MEPSPPLPSNPLGHPARQSSSSLASIRSKSSNGLNRPSRASGLWIDTSLIQKPVQREAGGRMESGLTDSGFHNLGPSFSSHPDEQSVFMAFINEQRDFDEQRLRLQTLSSRPVPQVLFKEAEVFKSNSVLPYHPHGQGVCDEQSLTLQLLTPCPLSEVLFKEAKSASNLRFDPYLRMFHTPPLCQDSTPPLVVPVRAPGKVEEGTTHDGTFITTSNPFALTERVICSTSHHVPSSMESTLHDQSSTPHAIPLQHLKTITDNFSDKRILGKGGSGVVYKVINHFPKVVLQGVVYKVINHFPKVVLQGVVYKGVPKNGEIIAVKKILSSLMPGLQKQFENEVSRLMELKHHNIVRCVGYCYEVKKECLQYNGKYVFAEMAERLLCLEYMPNGSLDKYISDEYSGLDWSTRYKIIEGICYGLCHLHEQNGKPIIHLDLKPANILLDDGMVPKITDFGLSRLLDQQQTICTASGVGTFGYMAPEFLHGGTITPKSDIFSLGVIIMEVVTGHRDYPDVTRTSADDFIKLVHDKWRNVLERSLEYGSLETNCQQIKRCTQIGLICVNLDRNKRPPITKVICMLQGSESIDWAFRNEAA